jgi:hypothetical protein
MDALEQDFFLALRFFYHYQPRLFETWTSHLVSSELFPRLNQLREGRCLEQAHCHLISEVKEGSFELRKFDLQF